MPERRPGDGRRQPPLDRLDRHARELLYQVLLNERHPVAVVGSGMSVTYGGVTWWRAVDLGLRYAQLRLTAAKTAAEQRLASARSDSAQQIHQDKVLLRNISRHLSPISIYRSKHGDPLKSSSDKYVALELCKNALDFLDTCSPEVIPKCLLIHQRRKGDSTFRLFFKSLFQDDTLIVRLRLAERFYVSDLNDACISAYSRFSATLQEEVIKTRLALYRLEDESLQHLASYIYSMNWISANFRRSGPFDECANLLQQRMSQGWLNNNSALPIDRRSLMNFWLSKLRPEKRIDLLAKAISRIMTGQIPPSAPHRPLLDPLRALQNSLGIKRYITLNFDFELENNLILDDIRETKPRPLGLEWAKENGVLEYDGETGGLTRRFPDGLAASTDIYNEQSVGRLFEFALDSSEYRAQILHLHGRADNPGGMILTDTDSNNQYRRDRMARTSLEQALDVILTGNAIIFVGIGLTEPEITRALRELVSRGQAGPNNPTFAIMSSEEGGTAIWRNQISFYRQFGIHIIAAGLPASDLEERQSFHDAVRLVSDVKARVDLLAPDDGAPIAVAADHRLLARCLGKTLIADLWLDGFVFAAIVRDISQRQTKPRSAAWRNSIHDYLDNVKQHLQTVVVYNAIRDLREESQNYGRMRMLPDDYRYDGSGLPLDQDGHVIEFDQTSMRFGLRLRDSSLWTPRIDKNEWRYHTFSPEADRHGFLVIPTESQGPFVPCRHFEPPILEIAKTISALDASVVTLFSPLGSGKGALVRALGKIYAHDCSPCGKNCKFQLGDRRRPSLILNSNFGFEFDTTVMRVQRFIADHLKQIPTRIDRLDNIKEMLENGSVSRLPKPVIILTGIERLINASGSPIAPDFDLLLSHLISPEFDRSGLQLLIVGSDGCSRYIETLIERAGRGSVHVEPVKWPDPQPFRNGLLKRLVTRLEPRTEPVHSDPPGPRRAQRGGPSIELQVRIAQSKPTTAMLPNSARSPALESMLRVVLERWQELTFPPDQMTVINRHRAELDREILGALAFVGMPVELIFVRYLTITRERLAELQLLRARGGARAGDPTNTAKWELDQSVLRLAAWGMIVCMTPYAGRTTPRVVLHRSVLAEVRERYGIRSGGELLSNTFSLTLAVSMPTDLVLPDWDINLRLKEAVGRLRGAWKDTDLTDVGGMNIELQLQELDRKLRDDRPDPVADRYDERIIWEEDVLGRLDRWFRMVAFHDFEVCIRAAAGIVRGYFSAASLVAQITPEDHVRVDGEHGEFEEHKRRLQQIVERLRESQAAYDRANALLDDIAKRRPKHRALVDRLKASLKLANRGAVNPRPAALYGGELIWLFHERGVVALLQGDLYEAQRALRETYSAIRTFRSEKKGISFRRLAINRSYVQIERGRIRQARQLLLETAEEIKDMEETSSLTGDEPRRLGPLITGYLGLCDHLEAKYVDAKKKFRRAIVGMNSTDQQRALAVTYIRLAALNFGLGEMDDARMAIRLGLAAAQSGRQIDILWRARLSEIRGFDVEKDRHIAEKVFVDARRYAEQMDLPRIAVQAYRAESEFRLRDGDVETAGLLAAEAMTIATRYGMRLQRIALRTVMGEVLLRRGDPSGKYLLEKAIDHADRIGYQLQVDRAQSILLNTRRLIGSARDTATVP